jgi:FKBP-type peptidyl-prolyl cis-trans isomerase FklB
MTPTQADTVAFHYRGTLISGTEFASSHRSGRPAILKLPKAIPGWQEALKLMPAGSRWQLFIPPQLAYGTNGLRKGKKRSGPNVGIGPDETLVFEVDLLAIKPGPAGTTTAALGAAPTAREK